MHSLWGSLYKQNKVLKQYDDIINDQVKLDFIEEVDIRREHTNDNLKHYLPHHAVVQQSLTTPIRIVFDCSAKRGANHPSLNDCLITGPPMLNDLTSILMRFRMRKYACSADIEKAFLMVGLHENDRDACRFFWPADPFNLH